MFLMLVISRLSSVRITSAASRTARVVSLKYDVQSTTTRSCVRRSASRTFLTPSAVISSAISGDGGASSTRTPEEWLIRNVSSDSSVAGLELGDEVRDRLVLGVQVEQDADVAELERGVDEDDLLAELRGRGDGEVDRDRRPADAALGAEDRDDLAGLAARRRCGPRRPAARAAGGDRDRPRSGSACRARGR